MDEEAFKALCSNIESKGLEINKAMPLQIKGEQLPVAWILQATLSGATDSKAAPG